MIQTNLLLRETQILPGAARWTRNVDSAFCELGSGPVS